MKVKLTRDGDREPECIFEACRLVESLCSCLAADSDSLTFMAADHFVTQMYHDKRKPKTRQKPVWHNDSFRRSNGSKSFRDTQFPPTEIWSPACRLWPEHLHSASEPQDSGSQYLSSGSYPWIGSQAAKLWSPGPRLKPQDSGFSLWTLVPSYKSQVLNQWAMIFIWSLVLIVTSHLRLFSNFTALCLAFFPPHVLPNVVKTNR